MKHKYKISFYRDKQLNEKRFVLYEEGESGERRVLRDKPSAGEILNELLLRNAGSFEIESEVIVEESK